MQKFPKHNPRHTLKEITKLDLAKIEVSIQ